MRETLAKKVAVPLLLLAAGGLLGLGAFYRFLGQTAGTAQFLSAAGRQRLLSHQIYDWARMVALGQEEDREGLRQRLAEFERALAALERGGRVVDEDLPPAPPEVLDEIEVVKRLWAEIQGPLLVIASRPAGDRAARLAFQEVESRLPRLSSAAHQVVTAYVARVQALRTRMLYTLAAIFGLDVLLFVVVLWLSRRYLIRPVLLIREGTRRMQAGDFSRPVPIVTRDELAALAQSFNDMSATLQESEEQLRALFEEAPVAYHEIDREGIVRRVNRAECALLGFEPSEILGKPIWEFVAPERREISRQAVRRKISGEQPIACFQREYVRRDGARLVLEIHENLIHDKGGGVVGIRSTLLDVTERRRAEEALRASQDRLDGILNISEDAIVSVDENQRITLFNRGAEKIFGYSAPEVLGQPLDLLLPARFRESHREHIRGFAVSPDTARRKRERPEIFGRRKDGAEFPAEASISKLELRGEKVLTVTLHDITERKKMQDALRRERDFISAVLDTAGALVVVLDTRGRIVRFNRACERTTGYSFEEVRGKLFWDLFLVREEVASVTAVFRALVAGQFPKTHENYWVTRDGNRRLIAWSNTALLNSEGAVEYVIGTGIDITERKRAEEALAEEANLLHTLIDLWPDYIFVKDAESRFILNNLAHRRCLGATMQEEVIGKTDFDFFPEELAARYYADEQEVIRSGQPLLDRDEPTIERSGERMWLATRKVPWLDSSGKVVGIVGMSQDITDRKLTQEKLEHYAEELRRKNEELAAALAAAKEATELKGRFLANMSHEIRTPMNGVLGMTELLLSTPLDPEQREYASSVLHSAETLLRIINDILDFSKIEAGKLELEHIPFGLAETVEEGCSLMAIRAAAKGLELSCLIAPEAPRRVYGDPGRLRQVLTNLVGNAIKFTEQGEVVVRAELVGETVNKVTIRFTVEDTGIGIPPDQLPRLFQSFVQGDGSTTRKHGGTGLGLAISKQLAEMMGGEIGVESKPGGGSRFWFTAVFEKQQEVSLSKFGALTPLEGLPVLVADDNAANRAVLRRYLQSWGCQSQEARGWTEAIQTLRKAAAEGKPFRVALLDLDLPGLDGRLAGQAIQSDPLIRDTVRIALSSASIESCGAPRLQEMGFAGYLRKPIRQSRLYEALIEALAPCERQDEQPIPPPPVTPHPITPEPQRRQQVRILLAEDNEVNQRIALRILQKAGYQADAVTDGRQAVEAVRSNAYDMVLMDVQMPVLDGLEATAEIRRLGATRHTPIIAMTANAMAGDRETCLAAGMDDYISKPVRGEELLRVIDRWAGGEGDVARPPEIEWAGPRPDSTA